MNLAELRYHFEECDRMAKLLGIKVIDAHAGYSKVSMELEDHHRNGVGLAHGGAIFTLADLAFAVAANADRPTVALSAQTSLSFLRAGSKGPLTAEAHTIHEGRTLLVVDVNIRDGEQNLLAAARITGSRTSRTMPAPQQAQEAK